MNMNATILGQTIAFIIFVGICMKYVWPPIMQALTQRQQKIADGLAAADRASRDLELAHEKVGALLREAKEQAADIIEQANKRAGQIVDEAKDQAREEGERLISAAKADADREFNRAKEELRTQVGTLAVAGAERILGEAVNESVQAKLVDQLVAEL